LGDQVTDDVASGDEASARPTDAGIAPQSTAPRPTVWVLTGSRVGDNNQMLALADALGLPFEVKQLTYNRLRRFAFLRGQRLVYLTRRARRMLTPPWPDLVIGLGYDSMPVSRYIRDQSGGRTRLVQLGNPRTTIDDLDLVITTPQYPQRAAPNVLELPFPIGNPAEAVTATEEEEQWLAAFPRPRRLVAVGGSTRQWEIDNVELDHAIRNLKARCASRGGSVIAVTSRRTTPATSHLLEARLTGEREACVANFPRFAVLLARCDECYVTADSVSMLSEAVLTGKPVGMIPIARSFRGRVGHWFRTRGWNLRSHADLSKFWDYLTSKNLVGTVDSPVASKSSDTVAMAVSAVRKLIEVATPRAA
jgi:mitochondrial fission protein ELM1